MTRALLAAGLIAAICVTACEERTSDQSGTQETHRTGEFKELAQRGYAIFTDRGFGAVPVACNDCHTEYAEHLDTTRLYPAHTLLGAANRRTTWYGEFKGQALERTGAGAAKCALIYQERGETLFDALSQDELDALLAFYRYISTGEESRQPEWEALSFPGDTRYSRDSLTAIADSLSELRGDPRHGGMLFRKACEPCHARDGEGIGPHPRFLRKYEDKLFLYVRAGRGIMPFFSYDKLTNQDVADIREYVAAGAK